ncbi:MAG: agmatine deiminase family protein [Bacteroidales bacterium]|nr:agmatine deiminase family protein [Bacteroidales bacterium]
MKKIVLLLSAVIAFAITATAQPIYNKDGIELKHIMTPEEAQLYDVIDVFTVPTDPPAGDIRPVAEYEPAEAVLVRYPFGIPVSLIKEMAEDAIVITIVSSTSQQNTVMSQYTSQGVNTDNCQFLIANTDSYWTRDYGPWFLAIDNHEIAIYDFTYNRPRPNDNNVNTALATYLGLERYASNIETAGGNYMCDNTSEAASTDLILEENSGYTEAQIRQHFQEYLGIDYYHIMEDPLQDYIKHIDCWGKFLAPNKVMIGQVPQSDSRYPLFEAAAEYFESVTCPWGTPYEVYRVYTPGAEGWNGSATPYTNSLILNNKVFVALSGNANDAAAIASYQAAMPGYEVIGVQYDSWEDTDALHCRTHEIADRCMLRITHTPLHGELEYVSEITLSADIVSYCDNPVYQDSVIAHVRFNGGEYSNYALTNVEGNTWEVTIDNLPDTGVTVEYYISAVDESGRKENHPYIGAADPHEFYLAQGQQQTYPEISLDATEMNFVVNTQGIHEETIVISNIGEAELTFNISDIETISGEDWLSVNPSDGTVAAGESLNLTVACTLENMTDDFSDAGSFAVNSNDPENPTIEVSATLSYSYVGIIDIEKNIFSLSPNPASNSITVSVESDNMINSPVRIKDMTGRTVFIGRVNATTTVINISDLKPGLYFVEIDADTIKFIKD